MNPQETNQPHPGGQAGERPTPRTAHQVIADAIRNHRHDTPLAERINDIMIAVDLEFAARLAQSEQALQEARGAIATWRELAHKGYERWQENLDGDHRTIVQLRDQLTASEQHLGEAQTAVARGAEREKQLLTSHEAAEAFWAYWDANGRTHKHGFFESTWGGFKAALAALPPPTPAQPEAGDGGGEPTSAGSALPVQGGTPVSNPPAVSGEDSRHNATPSNPSASGAKRITGEASSLPIYDKNWKAMGLGDRFLYQVGTKYEQLVTIGEKDGVPWLCFSRDTGSDSPLADFWFAKTDEPQSLKLAPTTPEGSA